MPGKVYGRVLNEMMIVTDKSAGGKEGNVWIKFWL